MTRVFHGLLAAARALGSTLLGVAVWRRLPWPAVAGLAGSLALTLLTAEAAVRALDLFGSSYYEETSRYLLDTEPDPRLGYRHRRGLETSYQGVAVDINSQGLRERSIRGGLGKRILLLGDSVTFGWGVEAEQTFGRRLEELFPSIETINAGVCGYNTVQQLRYLESDGLALKPDAIFLLYVENDVQPVLDIRRERSTLDLMLRASRLGRLGYHLMPLAGGPAGDDLGRSRRESFQALDRIAVVCRRERIPLAVFFYRLQISDTGDALWIDIARTALRHGFSAADTAPWFEGRDTRDLTNSFADSYPNAAAHAILAAGMAETIAGSRQAARLR